MSKTKEWQKAIPKLSPLEMVRGLQAETLICLTRNGDGLKEYGIENGDVMIFAPSEWNHEDGNESQIECWAAWRPEEKHVGFACDNFGDVYVYKDKHTEPAILKKHRQPHRKGILVGVIKQIDAKCDRWEENGASEETEETKSTGEKTVICANCEKEETGSPSFFRGLGWHITEDAAHCPSCW
jgi:hypothetical protein